MSCSSHPSRELAGDHRGRGVLRVVRVSSILSWPLAKLQNSVVEAQPSLRKKELENHKNTEQKEWTGHPARLSRKQWRKATRPSAQASRALRSRGPAPLPASSPLTGSLCVPDFLAGVSISSELLDLMALRYSDGSGSVSFPSLVCFLMRLEAMASKCHLNAILGTFTGMKEHRRWPEMHPCPRPGPDVSRGVAWGPA